MARMIVTANKLNRRSSPIANVADKNNVIDTVSKGFSFDSIEQTNNDAGAWFKDNGGRFYWGGGLMIDITTIVPPVTQPAVATSSSAAAAVKNLLKAPATIPGEMPLSHDNCIKCANWLKQNFEDRIAAAVENTPFDTALVYAITCQETAQRWILWIKDFDAKTVLERSVFDASGDIAGTSRSAFPKNKAEMIGAFGNDLTQMLVNEANKMRAMPQPGNPHGFSPAGFLYKGYGIFQYDLQHIKTDKSFFEDKLWGSIDACVDRLLKELNTKWNLHKNDMLATVKAYNGAGARADQYAQNVSQFYTWIKSM